MSIELEKYCGSKSRFICPKCKHKSEFTRYINTYTKKYISDNVGICNRIEKCGYHLTPKEYFKNRTDTLLQSDTSDTTLTQFDTNDPRNVFDTLPIETIAKTLDINLTLSNNNFAKYLFKIFSDSLTIELIKKFTIGTAKNNYTVFYQIDNDNKIRTGKKILFDPDTGKRNGEITFIHKTFTNNFNLKQCFFGLQQINRDYENIAIFESEKTAIIMSVYLENFICLATGGANMISIDKFKILKEKKCKSIILCPDKSLFGIWSEKAIIISKALNLDICISKFLEKNDNVKTGEDIADHLEFDNNYNWALSTDKYPIFWDF